MPGANSVTSNQETIHKDLEEVVRKYVRTTFLRGHNARVRTTILRALFLRLMTADDVRDPEDNMDKVWIRFG